MRFSKIALTNNVSQKKRYIYKRRATILLSNGSASFYFFHTIKFECVYLKFLRRRIKLLIKKIKKKYLSRKIWINLKANYPLSKKSKNSRMGKGKGSFLRWVIIIKPMLSFLEFFGFNAFYLISLKNKLKYLYHSDIKLFLEYKTICLWARPNFYKFFNYNYRRAIY